MSRLRNLSQVFNSSPEIKLSIKEELKIHLHQLDVVTRQTLHNIDSQKEVIEKINNLFEKNRQTKERILYKTETNRRRKNKIIVICYLI